ncbi:MAG: phage integrase N-terminal SAM-like domain-containing protein, partial [Bellilinea sp.]|nr:phage integrase N-terminal SAM-like domain-containing protein [Bellilinea sp.]
MTTKDLLLFQAIEGFLMARRADGYSPQTVEQYQWALSMLKKQIEDKPLQQVSVDDLRRFMASVQENPSL